MVILKMWYLLFIVCVWGRGALTADEESVESGIFNQVQDGLTSDETSTKFSRDVNSNRGLDYVMGSSEEESLDNSASQDSDDLSAETQNVIPESQEQWDSSTVDPNSASNEDENSATKNEDVDVSKSSSEELDVSNISAEKNDIVPMPTISDNKTQVVQNHLNSDERSSEEVDTDDFNINFTETPDLLTANVTEDWIMSNLYIPATSMSIDKHQDISKRSILIVTTMPSAELNTVNDLEDTKSTNLNISDITTSKTYISNLNLTTNKLIRNDKFENYVGNENNTKDLEPDLSFEVTELPSYIYNKVSTDVPLSTLGIAYSTILDNSIKSTVTETGKVIQLTTELASEESSEYTDDDQIPFLIESTNADDKLQDIAVFSFTADPITFDEDVNETAEDIFNDQNYSFSTTRPNSNIKGILEAWLIEQKQKISNIETTTERIFNTDTNLFSRLKVNDFEPSLQERLFDNNENISYFYGKVVDHPCVFLNTTCKISLNDSQVKLSPKYDTFVAYRNNSGSITFNANDDIEKINISIKFNVTCTEESCALTTIGIKLYEATQATVIKSEQKDINLLKTAYGSVSENKDTLTYLLDHNVVFEINFIKLQVAKYCDVAEPLGAKIYYKEIIGGSLAVFLLAAVVTYVIIRSRRKQKIDLRL